MEIEPSFGLDLEMSGEMAGAGHSNSDFLTEIKTEPSAIPGPSSDDTSAPQRLHSEEDVFRSMKIKDTSTTPYSDATQVSPTTPAFNLFPLRNSKLGRSHYEKR